MKIKNTQEWIARIAETVAALQQQLAPKGRELTADLLQQALWKQKEIKKLFSEKATEPKTAVKLEAKYKQVAAQKEKLLKQIQAAEEQAEKNNRFYRQALSTLIHLIGSSENNDLNTTLAECKVLLQDDADTLLLSESITRLREITIQEDFQAPEADKPQKKSFLGKLLKTDAEGDAKAPSVHGIYVKHLKTAYRDILDQLRLYMSKKYLEALADIGKRIRKATSLEDFPVIRQDMLGLISEYTGAINVEREMTAEFVREIGKRLIDLEQYLLETITASSNQNQSHQAFNTLLEKQLNDLSNSVDFSKTLAEVKEVVVSKLEIINQALESKRQADSHYQNDAEKKVAKLQKHLAAMKQKISSAQEQSKLLKQELMRDPLTGAYNRRAYDRTIESEMSRYLRYQRPFSLLLLDVDHFKKINDTYGHAIGDKCLIEIIKRIQPALRETDFLARYGGEEFTVILPETTGDIARQAAERLRGIVAGIAFLHKKEQISITISIGVTEVSPADQTHETVFQRTDQALYQAKKSGRNRVTLE